MHTYTRLICKKYFCLVIEPKIMVRVTCKGKQNSSLKAQLWYNLIQCKFNAIKP